MPPRVLSASCSSIRVLHISPALFGANGVFGGAERYVLELAKHMAKGTPTTLLTFGDRDHEYTEGPLRIRILKTQIHVRGERHNPLSAELFSEVRKAEVVHCHQQHILASSTAAALARLFGRKVMVTDLGGGGWDVSSYVSTDSWFHAHLHISEYSRRIFGHTGRPSTHVIYGGVNTNVFTPSPKPFSGERPVVYAGRLLPHKGINYLIEALPPGISLEIIGRPYHTEFLKHLQDLAAGKSVWFRHECSDEQLIDAYRRCLCIVLPSVYKDVYGNQSTVPELLGQTLLEGMACGRPAICTNVASMPEIVTDGQDGFVVPPNSSAELRERLEWFKVNPLQADAMGRRARATVLQRFTWETVVDRCLQIYASIS